MHVPTELPTASLDKTPGSVGAILFWGYAMFWRWRKATWALAIFNVLMLVWAISAGNVAQKNCAGVTQANLAACQVGTGVGTGVALALIIGLWFIGFIVLALIWIMSRPSKRQCPQCGRDVKKGLITCKRCGFSFAQQFSRA